VSDKLESWLVKSNIRQTVRSVPSYVRRKRGYITVRAYVTASSTFTYHSILYQTTSNKADSGLIDVENEGLYAPSCP